MLHTNHSNTDCRPHGTIHIEKETLALMTFCLASRHCRPVWNMPDEPEVSTLAAATCTLVTVASLKPRMASRF